MIKTQVLNNKEGTLVFDISILPDNIEIEKWIKIYERHKIVIIDFKKLKDKEAIERLRDVIEFLDINTERAKELLK